MTMKRLIVLALLCAPACVGAQASSPVARPSIWTLEAYISHNEAIRSEQEKFQGERDRRYMERDDLRAQALKIKEEGDARALELARQIQTYKDEKANELRSQIERERGTYVTWPMLLSLLVGMFAGMAALIVNVRKNPRGR